MNVTAKRPLATVQDPHGSHITSTQLDLSQAAAPAMPVFVCDAVNADTRLSSL